MPAPHPAHPQIANDDLTLEMLHRTARLEFTAVRGSVLGVVLVLAVQWGASSALMLASFALFRLGALAHNHWIASRLLRTSQASDLGTLPNRMLLGMVVGGAGWGSMYWMIDGAPSGRAGDLVLLSLPILSTALMLITTAHWPRGMVAFIGSMWLAAGSRLLFDPQWRSLAAIGALVGMLIVISIYGRQLLKQTRNGVAAELLSHRLAQELSTANARLNTALEQATRLATRDPMTGLLNRRAMLEKLAEVNERMARGAGAAVVMMVDLDHFKHINDRFGHSVGDEVLIDSAACLATRLRSVDLVGRWGGEEFLVVLPSTRADDGGQVAEALRARLSDLRRPAWPAGLGVTASIGLAPWVHPGGFEAAIESADQALYRAKSGGRNRVEVADTVIHTP